MTLSDQLDFVGTKHASGAAFLLQSVASSAGFDRVIGYKCDRDWDTKTRSGFSMLVALVAFRGPPKRPVLVSVLLDQYSYRPARPILRVRCGSTVKERRLDTDVFGNEKRITNLVRSVLADMVQAESEERIRCEEADQKRAADIAARRLYVESMRAIGVNLIDADGRVREGMGFAASDDVEVRGTLGDSEFAPSINFKFEAHGAEGVASLVKKLIDAGLIKPAE